MSAKDRTEGATGGRAGGRTEDEAGGPTEAHAPGDPGSGDAGGRWSDGAVFQVLASDDDSAAPAGAGFLAGDVRDGAGLTCAHVVRAAGRGPGGRVRVAFPNLPGAPHSWAKVPATGWRDPEAEDVAVLRIETVPAGALALRVGISAGCRGHTVRSYGFPAHAPPGGHFGEGTAGELLPGGGGSGRNGSGRNGSGENGSGRNGSGRNDSDAEGPDADGPGTGGPASGRLLQLSQANDLTTGFSGAPVVDEVTRHVIGMVTSFAPPDAHLRGQNVAYATPAEVLRDVRPELAQPPVCPYLGLEPFTSRHTEWFHGRAAAVQRVLSALGERRRTTLLLGPSGAGKSSLVSAGVLPALARGALPGSERWLPLYVRPGQDLLAALEAAGLPGASTAGPAAAAGSRLAGEPRHDRLLLVVDQFEELLAQASAPGGAARLDAAARELVALDGSSAPVTVLLVIRDDFYARLGALAPDLQDAAVAGLCNIPATLRQSELKAIITGPAAAVGVPVKDDLADRIAGDVLDAGLDTSRRASYGDAYGTHETYETPGAGGLPGPRGPRESRETREPRESRESCESPASPKHPESPEPSDPPGTPRHPSPRQAPATLLPLLELALRELFEGSREVDGSLTHAAYDAIGGVTGSMAVWCERALDALRPEQRPTARRLLTALVRPADEAAGTPATRQLVPLERLRALAGEPQRAAGDAESAFEPVQVDAVLAALTRYRIVTTGTAADGEPAAELIHDALIRDWADLRDWVARDREFQTWLRRAAEQQRQYAASRLPGDLLDGSLLSEGEEWSSRRSLPPEIAALLAASRGHRHAALRRTRRLNAVLAGMLGLALIAGGVAVYQARAASESQMEALSRELAAQAATLPESNPDLRSLLAANAWRISSTNEAERALYEAPAVPLRHRLTGDRGDSGPLRQFVFSPDGGRTVAGVSGGTSGSEGTSGAGGTSGAEGEVFLWDTETGESRGSFGTGLRDVQSVAYGEHGTVVVANDEGETAVWDVDSRGPAHPRRSGRSLKGIDGSVRALLSPDGRSVATADERGRVTVRSVETGKATAEDLGGADDALDALPAMAFSGDGQRLAVSAGKARVGLWDVADGDRLKTFEGGQGPVRSLAVSHDGETVASGSSGENAVRLWSVRSGKKLDDLKGNETSAPSLAFSRDGSSLVSTNKNGVVRVWDLRSRKPRGAFPGHGYSETSAAVSPDGRHVVGSGGPTGVSARLWDARVGTSHAVAELPGRKAVKAVAFRRGGGYATAGADGSVRLWTYGSGDRAARPAGEAAVHKGPVETAAFAPGGRALAVVGEDGTVGLWDAETGKSRLLGGSGDAEGTGDVEAVAFSPDGDTLATAGGDGVARLWNVRTGERVGSDLKTAEGASRQAPVTAVAFDGDGGTLATATGGKGRIHLWDVPSGKPRTDAEGLHGGRVNSMAFSPDGESLVAAGSDAGVKAWATKDGELQGIVKGSTDGVRAVAFAPDEAGGTFATAGKDGAVRLRDLPTDAVRDTLNGHTGAVTSAALSSDGRTLVTGSDDGTARLWDVRLRDPEEIRRHVCDSLGRDLSREDREQYLPHDALDLEPACPEDGEE